MDELRRCVKCNIIKPATHEYFYKDKNRYLGLMYRCKECDKLRKDNRSYEYRKSKMTTEQLEKKLILNRKYGKTIKGKSISLLNAYKKTDKIKNRICDLTQEDLIYAFKSKCVYCGFNATGFDRIYNNIGHIKSNCVTACKDCNIARMNNFTHEEMFIIGKSIRLVKLNRLLKE